jgi:putative ABC transport system substrate-binding protein
MKRREFITLVGGAAAWPLVSRAQNNRVRRVGMLMNLSADDIEATARIVAFVQELQRLGWTVGHNLQIEYRWGAGDADKFRKYAAELAMLAPDVIVTSGAGTVAALLQATSNVPIVFALVADPIGAGFVDSLALAVNGWSCSRRSRRT